jgi:Coenzyme PQQ synthesis protein D (PqqD)
MPEVKMLNANYITPNDKEVAAQVLDGEAVMINLSNGFYYSMDNVGAFIWEKIAAGNALDAIVTSLTQRYDVPQERAQADMELLVTRLLEENLVVASEANTQAAHAGVSMTNSFHSSEPKLPYAPPKLEIYRDIGHLVALDPPMPGLKDLPWSEPSDGKTERPRN